MINKVIAHKSKVKSGRLKVIVGGGFIRPAAYFIVFFLIFAFCVFQPKADPHFFAAEIFAVPCFAQESGLLLDDFEGIISGGSNGTVDFGSGAGSSVEVSAARDIKHSGGQSLKVVFDSLPGGYMWIARGYGLDAKDSFWLVKPEIIDWGKYKGISFYIFGSNSGAITAVDLKDNTGELWRYLVTDNFNGWQKVDCLFEQFSARTDWQPDSADKNYQLDFPVQSYQFEILPPAKGSLYFDQVELINK